MPECKDGVVVRELVTSPYKVAGYWQFRSKLYRADSHIKDKSLLGQVDLTPIVLKSIQGRCLGSIFVIRSNYSRVLSWNQTSKNEDLRACNLRGTC